LCPELLLNLTTKLLLTQPTKRQPLLT